MATKRTVTKTDSKRRSARLKRARKLAPSSDSYWADLIDPNKALNARERNRRIKAEKSLYGRRIHLGGEKARKANLEAIERLKKTQP